MHWRDKTTHIPERITKTESLLGSEKLALLLLQDLTYIAVPGSGKNGNLVSIEYTQFTPGVKSTKTIQDIDYEAVDEGVAGDLINIIYTSGATKGSEIVTVSTNDIGVQIEDGVSTVDDIISAIAAFGAAAALVNTVASGTGLETQTTQSQTFLANGADAIGDAGNEIVSVVDEAISIKIEDGVSDADQVKAAFDAKAEAVALASVVVSGTGGNAQDIVAPINLSGGLAAVLKANAFTFEFRPTALRINSRDMQTIDFQANAGSDIEFEQGGSTFSFEKADVRIIRRLRTRKYSIEPIAVTIV